MKTLTNIIIAVILALLSITTVHAASETAYPIPQLGNCRDRQECFYYCEIPANHQVCLAFAAGETETNVLGETVNSTSYSAFNYPIAELGNCASKEACYAYCSLPENRQACISFGQKHHLPYPTPTLNAYTQKLIQEAKSVLGCDYATTCREFCTKEGNREKCANFMSSFYENNKQLIPHQNSNQLPSPKPTLKPTGVTGQSETNVDCSISSNRERCISYGSFCSKFCKQNSSFCNDITSNTVPTRYPTKTYPSAYPTHQSYPTPNPTTSFSQYMERIRKVIGCGSDNDCYNWCREHADTCSNIVHSTSAPSNK